MEREKFYFHKNWYDAIATIGSNEGDAAASDLFIAICDYAFYGAEPDRYPTIAYFELIKPQLDNELMNEV